MSRSGRPRILVTGFGSFPGVPANPTAALVDSLRRSIGDAPGAGCDLFLDVLDVDYRALPAKLEAIGNDVRPDIAIHFGVSGRATGFAVENLAQNRVCTTKPDAGGSVPLDPLIRADCDDCPASLPVRVLVEALAQAGLPASQSDDAGDYLCNFLLFLSAGRHCRSFAPELAGFVRVPAFATVCTDGRTFDLAMLVWGAEILIGACTDHWRDIQTVMKKAAPVGAA